jgi:hypothetical protein
MLARSTGLGASYGAYKILPEIIKNTPLDMDLPINCVRGMFALTLASGFSGYMWAYIFVTTPATLSKAIYKKYKYPNSEFRCWPFTPP